MVGGLHWLYNQIHGGSWLHLGRSIHIPYLQFPQKVIDTMKGYTEATEKQQLPHSKEWTGHDLNNELFMRIWCLFSNGASFLVQWFFLSDWTVLQIGPSKILPGRNLRHRCSDGHLNVHQIAKKSREVDMVYSFTRFIEVPGGHSTHTDMKDAKEDWIYNQCQSSLFHRAF